MSKRIGKVFWLTGQPGHGKTYLGEQLTEFLKTERRNWRKSVFYIDAETIDEVHPTEDELLGEVNGELVTQAQLLSAFINNQGNDVVVSLISPNKLHREEFKKNMGNSLIEIYVKNDDRRKRTLNYVDWYQSPTSNFIEVDTTGVEPIDAYANLIHQLRNQDLI